MSIMNLYTRLLWGKTSVFGVMPWNLYQNERAQCPQLSTLGREWSEQNWLYAPRLKCIFALSPTGFEMRKMTKPCLTVYIKMSRTPLMESIFIYVRERIKDLTFSCHAATAYMNNEIKIYINSNFFKWNEMKWNEIKLN